MRIIYTKVFVNDQDKALKFYTQILGFVKKSDIGAGITGGSPLSRLRIKTVPSSYLN